MYPSCVSQRKKSSIDKEDTTELTGEGVLKEEELGLGGRLGCDLKSVYEPQLKDFVFYRK